MLGPFQSMQVNFYRMTFSSFQEFEMLLAHSQVTNAFSGNWK